MDVPGIRKGALWVLPMLCVCGRRSLILAGGAAVEVCMGLSHLALSFAVMCRMM